MKSRETRMFQLELEFESNTFESFMCILLKILFPSNQNVCIKRQLF